MSICNLVSTLNKLTLENTLKVGALCRYISTSSPLAFRATPILLAEPLKKKKRLDPAVVKAREDRKKRKIEKEIRRLEKNARQLKPIEECEVPLKLSDGRSERKRNIIVPEEIAEERILVEKKWSLYKQKQHLADIQMLDKLMFSQQKALDELKNVSEELYQAAIQIDETLLPFNSEGPRETPPIDEYDSPDGDYKDVSKVW